MDVRWVFDLGHVTVCGRQHQVGDENGRFEKKR
jgi:hypothetical protein